MLRFVLPVATSLLLFFTTALSINGAHGATIESTQSVSLSATTNVTGIGTDTASAAVQFGLFDPALGTLNSARFTISTPSADLGGVATLGLSPGLSRTLTHRADATLNVAVPLFGTGPFALAGLSDSGTCGAPCSVTLSDSLTNTLLLNDVIPSGSGLTALTGTGQFDIDFIVRLGKSTSVRSTVFGQSVTGDAPGSATTDWNVLVSVSYDYEPTTPIPQVPLPASLWLFGPGLISLIATARRKKS